MSAPVTGTFVATGSSAPFSPENSVGNGVSAPFNMSLWGTFVGTIYIERSFDNGATYLPITALGSSVTFSAPASEVFEEPEAGVLWRLRCSAYTSGTVNYRLSQ